MDDARMAHVIHTITGALIPVAPLRPVRARALTWAALVGLTLGGAAWFLGLRRDLPAAALSPALLVQVCTMAAVAGVAAVAALRLSVPGADRLSGRVAALGALGLFPFGLLAWDLVEGGTATALVTETPHLVCARTIALVAVVPAIVMAVMIRRGAPLRLNRAMAMAGVAGAGVGAVGVAVTCPIARVPHLLIAHALPTIVIAAALWVAMSTIVRRRRVTLALSGLAVFAVMSVVSAQGTTGETAAESRPPFQVVATTAGYMPSDALLEFLHGADSNRSRPGPFEGQGALIIGATILLGGVLLNLTPCVLPMLPINLAIIGAGRGASSRRRGWLLGGAYGSAMAVVYGVLGGIIVVTAGTFGVLNSSPWFNAGIAALFLVLGLAMFDVFTIDLSRWSGRVAPGGESRGSVGMAFFMGGVAALLAGACVAPVVIQVIALSSELYASGSRVALALPLILGVGMGLPWPFAGAGFAALPKPGAWMVRVKQGLGVCIFITAAYYGYEAYTIARPTAATSAMTPDGWHQSLDEGLAAAKREDKPIFLDVWATWCKNCTVMDATTFRDATVRAALDDYVKVRFQAEDLERPDVAALLDRLESFGLPTYAVLRPAAVED